MQSLPVYKTSHLERVRAGESLRDTGQIRSRALSAELDRVYEPVREELERVRHNLRGLAHSQSPFLAELLNHVLETSGKGVRPAFMLLASKFHPNDGSKAEIMASAVELLHIATLIHDDTVDNTDIRRGKITVSSKWGKNAAVLLGDYVFATSATFVCNTGDIRVVQRFSETAMQLSAGELHEMAGVYDTRQTREQYFQRIYNKTASLFTVTGETGAILSGAPEPVVEVLKEYGYNIGMVYQIVDDILDFYGTEEEVGKPVGNDLAQGIMTLPAIIAMELYPQDNSILRLFQRPKDVGNLKRAVDLVQSSSVIDESYAVAEDYCRKALRSLDALEDNRYRDALEELAHYVLMRRS